MSRGFQNKRKIINDPVYGFVSIHNDMMFDIIEHPYFQRLRRIKQLGLTHLVYPGALHTRFHHSVGAMHLMKKALRELRFKGNNISEEEFVSANIAILLHDIGHGPYSHALENSIVPGIGHEQVSEVFLDRFNIMLDGKLSGAIKIFKGAYHKKFLHELVSSQFDMDRLDYLKRDSFFSGVAEGSVNYERLLNMIDVVDDHIVIEAKGIYSVEKFITARRLMYWQVYLHKTVLAAELMIMKVLKRAKYLRMNGEKLFASPVLDYFLSRDITLDDFYNDEDTLPNFASLDDYDVFSALKVWLEHPDKVLSFLSSGLVNRKLFKIEMTSEKQDKAYLEKIKVSVGKKLKLNEDELDYFVISDKTSNFVYNPGNDKIKILFKDGSIIDIAEASDQLNISLLSKPTIKYFVCYPK
ncbi:MAG: HD domain-containing protein [Chlorobi bacterium]|nr:HD domain-containing protein [Chlorobiota bacterium]